MILQRKIDLIFNAGTAGALDGFGLEIGDIVMPPKPIFFLDRYSSLPEFSDYLRGGYAIYQEIIQLSHGFKAVNLGSGASLYSSPAEIKQMRQHSLGIKDMEAASIGRIASTRGTPFVALKAVSDFLESPIPFPQQFYSSLNKCCIHLAQAVQRVLNAIPQ